MVTQKVEDRIMRLSNYNEYPYTSIEDFLQDEAKMKQIAKGSIEGYEEESDDFIEDDDFDVEVLECIKAYSGQAGIGYPPTSGEDIEKAFEEYEIVEFMRDYLQKGIA